MPNLTKCPTCNGGGKVDNRDGKPWADITARRNPEVASGELLPISCPACRGSGSEPQKENTQDRAPVAAPDMRQILPPQPPAAPTTAPAPEKGLGGAPSSGAGPSKKGGK